MLTKMARGLAKFFTGLTVGYEIVRIPHTATGPDGRVAVEIFFPDGTSVVGEKKELNDGSEFLELAAQVSGPGSIAWTANELAHGRPL